MTAKIIKPTVNMIFAGDVTEESKGHLTITDAGSYFNAVGTGRWENLYIEIGPMDSRTYDYRVVVYDPKGNVVGTSDVQSEPIDKSADRIYPREKHELFLSRQLSIQFPDQIRRTICDGRRNGGGCTVAAGGTGRSRAESPRLNRERGCLKRQPLFIAI